MEREADHSPPSGDVEFSSTPLYSVVLATLNQLNPTGNYMNHLALHFAHRVFVGYVYESQNKH